jgi:hypothetical protein
MARTLQCDFSLKTERGPAYWWPLLFERLWAYNFQFASPHSPEGWGYYLSEEWDMVHNPFRALWDEVYTEGEGILAIFWFGEGDDSRTLELASSWRREVSLFEFSFNMPGADFAALSLEEACKWLIHILSLNKDIYELCHPTSAILLWEDSGGNFEPWASFDVAPKLAPEVAPIQLSEQRYLSKRDAQHLCSEELASGKTFYYIDPVPLARENGWDFISLQKEAKFDKLSHPAETQGES